MLDTAHQGLISYCLYWYLILHYGDLSRAKVLIRGLTASTFIHLKKSVAFAILRP